MSNNQTVADRTTVIAAVRRLLESRHPGGVTLDVVPDGVRQDQDWWYVPVRPSAQPCKRFEYYETLAEVENEIQKSEHLTVLLLPLAPYSVDFRFRSETSDAERSKVWDDLRARFSAGGVAGVENPYLEVQPDGDYWVVVWVRNLADAERVGEELRASPVIDVGSVSVKPEDTFLNRSST